jgi:hypothetical protein
LIRKLIQQKQPSITQGLPVIKKALLTTAFISVLLLSAIAGAEVEEFASGPVYIRIEEVPVPAGAEPPKILISLPKNNTSVAASCVSFDFNVTMPDSLDTQFHYKPLDPQFYYNASWENSEKEFPHNDTLGYFIDNIPEGSHKLTITAVGKIILSERVGDPHETNGLLEIYYTIYKLNGSSTVYFTVDLHPPEVLITSITNKTYNTSTIALNYTSNEPTSKVAYSIDGKENQTINGDTMLPELSNGLHNVTVYAWDEAGNVGVSETVHFSVNVPFPTALVAVASVTSVAIVSACLLVYFKKRH